MKLSDIAREAEGTASRSLFPFGGLINPELHLASGKKCQRMSA